MPEDEDFNYLLEHSYHSKLDRVMAVWLGVKTLDHETERYEEFSHFIGYPKNEDPDVGYIVDITKPEVRRIIDTLDGPHCTALLKVLEIRNGTK